MPCACGKAAEWRLWRMTASDVICLRLIWQKEPDTLPAKFICSSCLPGAVADFAAFVAMC
jgi:hypothetical protein